MIVFCSYLTWNYLSVICKACTHTRTHTHTHAHAHTHAHTHTHTYTHTHTHLHTHTHTYTLTHTLIHTPSPTCFPKHCSHFRIFGQVSRQFLVIVPQIHPRSCQHHKQSVQQPLVLCLKRTQSKEAPQAPLTEREYKNRPTAAFLVNLSWLRINV